MLAMTEAESALTITAVESRETHPLAPSAREGEITQNPAKKTKSTKNQKPLQTHRLPRIALQRLQ
ncbi:hypothetical protein [Helicobacter sp. T3_23-1056]